MKCMKTFLMLAMLVALALTASAAPSTEDEMVVAGDDETFDVPHREDEKQTSLRGSSRFLAQKPRATMTCDKYPTVCRTKGSPGPDCCKKKCVNVMTDKLNCGVCGKKCKFPEICCKGQCVNPRSNKRHCGGCNNKCKKGSSCKYGMCSYA
ncbi:hypothetical protein RJ639_023030 [Escallonia herrerae]|uniref:Stigma-specific STIG1-like protein 1 n=1 Tax=Escallonia herrerae TaxID=1293975 RepID=A0AA89AEE2_9ASTE|nr:hypothetical protein RJ639_023030 [Escallonia herrerae]